MEPILLGLGTNLGARAANLVAALDALAAGLTLAARSSVWETAPMHVLDQPAFLNMVVLAHGPADLDPHALLARLKALESDLGRVASVRYGPRLIDVDILAVGGRLLDDPVLTLPHPRLAERRFALAPLVEVAPDWVHPRLGVEARALLAALGTDQDCVCLGPLETLASGEAGAL